MSKQIIGFLATLPFVALIMYAVYRSRGLQMMLLWLVNVIIVGLLFLLALWGLSEMFPMGRFP